MRELELKQDDDWEAVPELALPQGWELARVRLWRETRRASDAALWVAKSLAWVGLAALSLLRAPELVREVAPGRPAEREHEWKARSQAGYGWY